MTIAQTVDTIGFLHREAIDLERVAFGFLRNEKPKYAGMLIVRAEELRQDAKKLEQRLTICTGGAVVAS